MTISNALASVAVADLDRARSFYEQLLGPPTRPRPDLFEWWLPDGGALQVYRLPERAGTCSCTFVVSDVDEIADLLRSTGRLGDSTIARDDRSSVLMVRDPDGNSIAFDQPHPADDAASRVVPHTTPTSADGPPERTPFA